MYLLNIHQCIGDSEMESFVKEAMDAFVCPPNTEIEDFLKLKAWDLPAVIFQ